MNSAYVFQVPITVQPWAASVGRCPAHKLSVFRAPARPTEKYRARSGVLVLGRVVHSRLGCLERSPGEQRGPVGRVHFLMISLGESDLGQDPT